MYLMDFAVAAGPEVPESSSYFLELTITEAQGRINRVNKGFVHSSWSFGATVHQICDLSAASMWSHGRRNERLLQ